MTLSSLCLEILLDTGIQIWAAVEVSEIQFPVSGPLVTTPRPRPPGPTHDCAQLCSGLQDGVWVSDGCCTPAYCRCPDTGQTSYQSIIRRHHKDLLII